MNNTVKGWIQRPQNRFDRYGQQRSWVRSMDLSDKDKAIHAVGEEGYYGESDAGLTAKSGKCI